MFIVKYWKDIFENTMHSFMPYPLVWMTMVYRFCFKKLLAHINLPFWIKYTTSWCLILIYSLSDSSESWKENFESSVMYLITFCFSFSVEWFFFFSMKGTMSKTKLIFHVGKAILLRLISLGTTYTSQPILLNL